MRSGSAEFGSKSGNVSPPNFVVFLQQLLTAKLNPIYILSPKTQGRR